MFFIVDRVFDAGGHELERMRVVFSDKNPRLELGGSQMRLSLAVAKAADSLLAFSKSCIDASHALNGF